MLISGKDEKKCKRKGGKKKKKCEEEGSVSISKKEEKSCRKEENKLASCIADGSYRLDLEEFSFSEELIEGLHKSKQYKTMIKEEIDERKDLIISNFLESNELRAQLQDVIVKFNETSEAQNLMEKLVDAVVVNETDHLESRFNEETARIRESEFEALNLLEQVISKLHGISIKQGGIYGNEKIMDLLEDKYSTPTPVPPPKPQHQAPMNANGKIPPSNSRQTYSRRPGRNLKVTLKSKADTDSKLSELIKTTSTPWMWATSKVTEGRQAGLHFYKLHYSLVWGID